MDVQQFVTKTLTFAAAALLLVGCATKREFACSGSMCTSVYTEDGRLTVAHHVSADPSAVERVASSYCQQHHLGKPVIKQPPDLSSHPQWAIYSFDCEQPAADAVAAKDAQGVAVAQQSAGPQPVGGEAERFAATCASLGFQTGTPEYGACLSKLGEMSNQADQLRQQQRKQAIRMIEQGLSGLSSPGASSTPATIRLPSGEVLTCTQTGNQVSCN